MARKTRNQKWIIQEHTPDPESNFVQRTFSTWLFEHWDRLFRYGAIVLLLFILIIWTIIANH
jgi:hypothetical protein